MVGDPNNQTRRVDESVTTGTTLPPDGESVFWIESDDTDRPIPTQVVHDLILRDVDLSDLWPAGDSPCGEEPLPE